MSGLFSGISGFFSRKSTKKKKKNQQPKPKRPKKRYSENDIPERAMNGSENNISKRNIKNAPVPNEECCCTKKSLCWISTITVTALLILLCIALSHIEWSPKEKTEEIDRETLNQLNVLKKEKLKLEEDVARLKKTNTGLYEQIGVLEELWGRRKSKIKKRIGNNKNRFAEQN
jgi:hypothetical protein